MKFTGFGPDLKKGKKNKLKVGQKVVAKQRLVDWTASHLCWCVGKLVKDDSAYDKGQTEIPLESLDYVYMWSGAKLSGKMPTGVVTHYGMADNDDRIDRKNVYIEFTFKTGLGNLKYGCYVHEKDLELIKAKSQRS
jgi:hypothetical protein